MRRLVAIFLGATLAGYAVGCRVSFNDDEMVFSCQSDGDCGGSGYVCVNMKYCCLTDGTEAVHGCDHRDNDCNGEIDEGAGTLEVCNGKDDDCDGVNDDGFDLIQDPNHCGGCDVSCMSTEACQNGVCVIRGEVSCSNGIDDDGDLKADCLDPDCNLQLCAPGCQCRALSKAEGNCTDDMDNDGDGTTDCADVDCEGAGCGMGGCNCSMGGKKETGCADGMDNDGDGMSDCSDADCEGELCQASPSTFRCGGGACSCNDGGTTPEVGPLCHDRKDNDCDGLVDCAEAACDGLSCALDGGAGCLCMGGAGLETNCADRRDNDNDGFTDCADSLPDAGGECPRGTACTYLNSGGVVKTGTCATDHTCK